MLIPEHEYRRWDAVEMAALVRQREVSAADLVETAHTLIESRRGLNAVADLIHPTDEPTGTGPLSGVPFAVKELLGWPGLPWTMGSRLMAHNTASGFSPYAARLRDSGVSVVCSTTSSEFGLLGSTETALRGVTHNPWHPELSAGGSSGGSASLVAAGVVPMAHGSDAGGSLRVPAALNGVFGFKPSNRRCAPNQPDSAGLAALLVEHCMSRSVRDSAHLLAATERDRAGAVYPPLGLVEDSDPKRLRVAVLSPTLLGRRPEAAVERELAQAAALCESLGHHVEHADPADVDGEALSRAFFVSAALSMSQMAQLVTPMLGRPPGPDELEPFTLELIDWAGTLGPDAHAESERTLADAARGYLRMFDRCDVVLSPTLARVSWPVGHLSPDVGREELIRRTEDAVGYTPIHNAAGCPAMSVPLGRSEGLPVGVHFAAPPGADGALLSLAYELEAAAPWVHRTPDMTWLARRT
jgi:amidase